MAISLWIYIVSSLSPGPSIISNTWIYLRLCLRYRSLIPPTANPYVVLCAHPDYWLQLFHECTELPLYKGNIVSHVWVVKDLDVVSESPWLLRLYLY